MTIYTQDARLVFATHSAAKLGRWGAGLMRLTSRYRRRHSARLQAKNPDETHITGRDYGNFLLDD